MDSHHDSAGSAPSERSASAAATPGAADSAPPRKRRLFLKASIALILLAGGLVALAPTIVGKFVPGIIATNAGIPGTVEVRKVSLGWFSAQEIGPIIVREKGAKPGDPPVATVTLKVSKGLTGLLGAALGSLDLGLVEMSGGADIVRSADGSTNLERALGLNAASRSNGPAPAPATGGSGAPPKIPVSLNATLNMATLRVSFTDERGAANDVATSVPGAHASGGGGVVIPRTIVLTGGTVVANVRAASGGSFTLNFSAKAAESFAGSGANAVLIGSGSIGGAIKATGWAKADGTLALDAATIDANVAMTEVPSAIADTFVSGLPAGTTIAGSLGPTIALSATVHGTPGKLDATLMAEMANVHASGEVAFADKVLALSRPLVVRVDAQALRAFVPQLELLMASAASGEVAPAGAGDLTLTTLPGMMLSVESWRLPLDMAKMGSGALDLRGTAFKATVSTSGETRGTIRLAPTPGERPQEFVAAALGIALESSDLAKGATVKGGTSVAVGGKPAGELAIDVSVKGLLDSRGAPIKGLPLLAGGVRLTGLATALAQAFVGKTGLDLAQDVGPTVDVSISTDIAATAVDGFKGGTGKGGASSAHVELQVKAKEVALAARALVSENEIRIESFNANATIRPETFQRLNPGDLKLVEPANVSIALGSEGLTIPMKNGRPDVRGTSPLEVSIAVPRIGIDGATMKNEDGTIQRIGRVGVEQFAATVRADVGAMLTDTPVVAGTISTIAARLGKVQVELGGGLCGPDGSAMGTFRASASAPLSSGRLTDAVKVGLALGDLSPAAAQSLLPVGVVEPGMFAGALGQRVGITVDAAITPPGKELTSLDLAHATAQAVVKVTGDRLSTGKPLMVDARRDTIALTSPGEFRFAVDPAWANAMFLKAESKDVRLKGAAPQKALTLMAPATLTMTIGTCAIARPGANAVAGTTPDVGILKPGVFEFDLDVRVPRVVLKQANGTMLEMVDLDVNAAHPIDALDGTIHALVTGKIGAAAKAGEAFALAPLSLTVSVSKLCTPEGKLDFDAAIINASGEIPRLPSALLDTFANQDGKLHEFIGETADVRLKAQNISFAPGPEGQPLNQSLLDLSVTSPRLSMAAAGKIVDNTFVASAPIEILLTEITPKAGAFVNAALPALGSIEKRAGADRPAKVTITDLHYPLDGTFEGLGGKVDIDPGEAIFAASTAFGEILKVVDQRTAGRVGQRLDPLTLAIVKGEIAIPKYDLRLGEFTIGTEGTVNLATRGLNVVTWIPFGALSDKVAGTVKLNSGVGSALGRVLPIEALTMIPFRTTGTFAKTGTTLDAELMTKTLVDTVRPDKIIERLPDLIPNFGGKKKAPPKPPPSPK